MALPNPIIGGHVYNWYETQFKFDAITVEGVLSVSGIKSKLEQAPQFGNGREAIDIATGKHEHDPITVTMYAHEWPKIKAWLFGKSLGRGYGLARFSFTAMASATLEGAPPIGSVWGKCKITEVGEEYGQDVNGFKIDVTFQPENRLDLDGMPMVRSIP